MNEEQMAAYLFDELDPEAKSDFECAMAEDAELRGEVEALREAMGVAREWAAADPPGIERVDQLPLPKFQEQAVPAHPSGLTRILGLLGQPGLLRKASWQAATAAAIFIVGVWVGTMNQAQEMTPPTSIATAQKNSNQSGTDDPEIKPDDPAPVEQAPPRRSTRHENGRTIIESTPTSGGSSIWVIDGSFELAESMMQDQDEDQDEANGRGQSNFGAIPQNH